jgi:hypothetical protein
LSGVQQGIDSRTRTLAIHAAWLIAGLTGCAITYSRAGSFGPASLLFALLGLAAVASHVWRGDEFERRLAQEAGVLVFVAALAVALALPLLTVEAQLLVARWAWAGLMTLWMLAWALRRLQAR